jgi:hypothetical protein
MRRTIIVSADGEIRIELDGDARDRASSLSGRLRTAGKAGWTIASAESFRALLRSWLGL